MGLWQFERSLRSRGVRLIAGVDESGRGPLAGPVVAAAVIFPPGFTHPRINDSKRLTALRRERLVPEITRAATAWAVGEAGPREIDEVNILGATLRAMERAVAALAVRPDYVVVDGTALPLVWLPGEALVGADRRVGCVAAASILAKVHRDRLMEAHHERWPVYRFNENKGYGTGAHLEALAANGPCPIHRRSFAPVREAAGRADAGAR